MTIPRYDVKQHYQIELELAERIRRAPAECRKTLYGSVYDELFRMVPGHPQVARKNDPASAKERLETQMCLLSRFIDTGTVFCEIGAGDCSLSLEVAKTAQKCLCVDVSREIFDGVEALPNMEFVISDGVSIPVNSVVDFAYSNQVIEHLHPDDATDQLKNIYKSLATGGRYMCITPNRLNGPHDVSKYVSANGVSAGLHLKEYTVTELKALLESVGFRRPTAYVGLSKRFFRVPISLLCGLERLLSMLPTRILREVARTRGVRNFLFISLSGQKLEETNSRTTGKFS